MTPLQFSTVQRTVNDLIPLDINPRKITEAKRMKMIESIQKFNLVDLPVVDSDNTVISGHQRLRALQAIGRGDEVIDVRIPNRKLTAKEVKEYNLLANTHFGEFDFEALEADFMDVDFGGLGMDALKMDFDSFVLGDLDNPEHKEADNTLTDTPPQYEAQEDDFETPKIEEVKTDIVLGDLFEFKSPNGLTHRLLCGDSTKVEDVERLMDGETVEMVFTDPPYNVSIKSLGSKTVFDKKLNKNRKATTGISQNHNEFKMASGEMSRNEFIDFLKSVFERLIENSKDGSIHFVCMDYKHIYEIINAGEIYTEFKQLCVWNKDNGGMGTFYRSKHELIFVFKNGKAKHTNTFELGQFGRYRTNVWDYPIVSSFANKEGQNEMKLHPTVKPLKLVADAILDCSLENEKILDLFGGSGTTMVAAEQMCRSAYLMELDEKYCQVIVNRMRKLDGDLRIYKNGIEI